MTVAAARTYGVGYTARVKEIEGSGAVQSQESGRGSNDEHVVQRAEAHVSNAGLLGVVLDDCPQRQRRQLPQPHCAVTGAREQMAGAARESSERFVACCHGVHGRAVVEAEHADAAARV